MLTRALVRDLVERTVATYVEVLCVILIATWTDVIDLSIFAAAAWAAAPAALAVVKGFAASLTGDPDTAAVQR